MCGVPEVGGVKEKGMALSWSLSPVLSPCSCFGNCIFCPQIFTGPVWSLLAIQAMVGNTPSFCSHRFPTPSPSLRLLHGGYRLWKVCHLLAPRLNESPWK